MGRAHVTRAARGDVRLSKLLALVLRHRPDLVGVRLDGAGWAALPTLLDALVAHGQPVTRADVLRVVETSDKQRFTHDESADRIRANQGHSVPVDLGLAPVPPPGRLYHGTSVRSVTAILERGIQRRSRQHVHLSADYETAARVGARRGPFRVLVVDAAAMSASGHAFVRSANGVWLTAEVPPRYLALAPEPGGAAGRSVSG